MAENDIKKAVEFCCNDKTMCSGCPLNEGEYKCGVYLTQYIAEKENEPAPAPTETSSEVSSSDTHKSMHLDDSPLLDLYQEELGKIAEIALGDYPNEFLTGYIVAVKDSIKRLRGDDSNEH